jgi:signal transduction histidine kinase
MTTRVLIVDDDQALLEALPTTLRLRIDGIETDTADSAIVALQKVRSTEYDAIISDIKMPGMDGLALLEQIRVIRPDTPVLLITGHGEHDLAVQALRGGAYDFIQKPVERDYLCAAISRAIEKRQLGRQVEEQRLELERYASHLEETVEERTRELTDANHAKDDLISILMRKEEELRKANEAKDEFLSMISHEMRTPITTIYAGASILRNRQGSLDAETRMNVLSSIQDEANQLRNVVADLFTLARLELGQQVNTEPVLAKLVIDRVTEAFLDTRPQRQLHLHVPEGLPPVDAEPTYLEQVLRNLLSNADKYSPASEPIEIAAKRNGSGELIISVRDKGPGVPEEELERIFDRFYRSPETADIGGTGIGLTVCKRLVEALSGNIWAVRREGGGLEVSFTLQPYKAWELDEASGFDRETETVR